MNSELAISDATHAGQAVYSPLTLKIYDLLVLALSNSLVWKCPTRQILRLYDEHVADDHLDVGVGTGWYLDHCRFPSAKPRIGLLDLNASSLAAAAKRIERYRPQQFRADVLQLIAIDARPFGSIALTYLLHCLPGSIADKAVAFDNLMPLLKPGGTMFGATLLSSGVPVSRAGRKLMGTYNGKGIFSNAADSLDGLQQALHARFDEVEVKTLGCGALFVACRPKASLRKETA